MDFSNHSRTSRAHHKLRRCDKETDMNTSFNQGSARIYQFPVGGRSAIGRRLPDQIKSSIDPAAPRVSEAAVGGAWYHEAAIEESKPLRER